MIRDNFDIKNWEVLILYDCTCEDTDYIVEALMDINCPSHFIKEAVDNIDACHLNTGLTYSNLSRKSSVIVVSKTSSHNLLFNTITHEYYHLVCHMKAGLDIEDEEELAQLMGKLCMMSYSFLLNNIKEVGFN